MVTGERTVDQAYQAALEAVLVVEHDQPGVLIVHGADRLGLLHRMSTNDVAEMRPFEARRTVFTDPVGRTIDLVTVLHAADRSVLVGSPGRAERLRDWLQKHIFFQDEVTLELPGEGWTLWGLYGPQADQLAVELATQAGLPTSDSGRLPAADEYAAGDATYAWRTGAPLNGCSVLTADDQVHQWLAKRGGQAVDRQAYEVLRIEAGLPAPDKEMLEDSIPLEIGLRPAIDFDKGCYVGQEIIARMDSRDQLAKQLMRLRLDGEASVGSALVLGDRTVGTITSVAHSPQHGWIGIGSVRSRAAQETELQVAGTELTAQVLAAVDEPAAESTR